MKKITAIGGGHGLSALLRALKILPVELTAIVTVADDGGSSGRIRQIQGIPAPGDVRSCLLALAEDTEIVRRAAVRMGAEYGPELAGHVVGNRTLAELTRKYDGDFAAAVREAHTLWKVHGRVLPATNASLTLCARSSSGCEARGESNVHLLGSAVSQVWLEPNNAKPGTGVREALAEADAILIGPGSLYTSILPALLVPGITDAIRESRARKAYLCNLTEEQGETDRYTATDHICALEEHLERGLFEFVMVNTHAPENTGREAFVVVDIPSVANRGYLPVTGRYWESPSENRFAEGRLRAFTNWLLSDEACKTMTSWRKSRQNFTYPRFSTVRQEIA